MPAIAYEIYNNQIGVKTSYLVADKCAKPESISIATYNAIYKQISKNKIIQLRRGVTNNEALVHFDSLPHHFKSELVRAFGEPPKEITRHLLGNYYLLDKEAYEYYCSYVLPNGNYLPLSTIDEYTANASMLNALAQLKQMRTEMRRKSRGSTANIWDSLSADINSAKAQMPHTLPENKDSLRKKFNEYQTKGYVSLISGKYNNSNAKIITENVINLLNGMFAYQQHKPTATEITRQYDAFLAGYVDIINIENGELYNPKDFRKLSESTIIQYLNRWENRIATHAIRSGDRQKYMAKYKTPHKMSKPKYTGSIITVDDRQPPFEYEKGKRMWLYLGYDVASGCCTTWVYGKSKEGIIIEFYRQMVRNYYEWGLSLPAELECESSLNSSFKNGLLAQGAMFQYVRISANNAREKIAERFHETMRYEFEKKHKGWKARPFARSEANQAGNSNENEIIPYTQLVQLMLKNIEDYNNSASTADKTKTKWDYFIENQNPELKAINWLGILPHIGYKTISSCNVGIVKLNNTDCIIAENGQICVGKQLVNKLIQIESKEIEIYWIDDNKGKIAKAFAYINDQCICELMPQPAYNRAQIEQTEDDRATIQAMSSYVSTVQAHTRHTKSEIAKVMVIENKPRTLNTKFQIHGLSRETYEDTMPEIMEDSTEEVPNTNPQAHNDSTWREIFMGKTNYKTH